MAPKERRWIFTVNNYTALDVENILNGGKFDLVQYIRFAVDASPFNTKQLRGYIVMKCPVGLTELKQLFGKMMHFEIMLGSLEEIDIYIEKMGIKIREVGQKPEQGKRNDVKDSSEEEDEAYSSETSFWKDWGPTVAVGAGAVVLAPVALSAAGFSAAGITAGSLASRMMSMSAIANGGGVPARGWVATLTSAGAAGISATGKAMIGIVAGAMYKTGESVAKLFRGNDCDNRNKSQLTSKRSPVSSGVYYSSY